MRKLAAISWLLGLLVVGEADAPLPTPTPTAPPAVVAVLGVRG